MKKSRMRREPVSAADARHAPATAGSGCGCGKGEMRLTAGKRWPQS
jgi:hypothetical protein